MPSSEDRHTRRDDDSEQWQRQSTDASWKIQKGKRRGVKGEGKVWKPKPPSTPPPENLLSSSSTKGESKTQSVKKTPPWITDRENDPDFYKKGP